MQYRFGDFVLDTSLYRLSFRSEPVALRPQALDALRFLIEQRHRVVTKEEILERVWQGSFVSDNSLSQCVREIRRAIGEEGQRVGSIHTVQRRGFRFVAEVTAVACAARDPEPSALPATPLNVAIAPFEALAGDATDGHLGRRVSVELARLLARRGTLPVLLPSSEHEGDAPEAALREQSGATYVVAGRVQQRGARARLHLHLLDSRSATVVWADRIDVYDSDSFGLQDGLALGAFGALEPELIRRAARETAHLVANESDPSLLIFHGIEFFYRRNAEDNQRAIAALTRAARSTRSVAATHYLGLAHYNNIYYQWHDDFASTLSQAAEVAERSLEVGPKEPFGHILTGLLHLFSGKSDRALASAELAVEMDPKLSEAHGLLGRVQAVRGFGDASIAAIETAMRLSPNEPWPGDLLSALAMGHFVAGRYEESARHAARAALLAPRLLSNHVTVAASRALLGDIAGATNAADNVRRVSHFSAAPLRRVLSASPKDLENRFFGGLARAGLDVR
jgi:DNA-binding winged helix-turn-helix (wHTH) protein/tetratricopeptide (TPR) repeat protein